MPRNIARFVLRSLLGSVAFFVVWWLLMQKLVPTDVPVLAGVVSALIIGPLGQLTDSWAKARTESGKREVHPGLLLGLGVACLALYLPDLPAAEGSERYWLIALSLPPLVMVVAGIGMLLADRKGGSQPVA
ncbi:MAG: hypothetical protein ABIZ70_08385 [Gemmatimonadales bacterium]